MPSTGHPARGYAASSKGCGPTTTQDGEGPGAMLMKEPKDLYVLWQEFEFGVGGTKPAKVFSAAKRGANKFAFCWRKVFWDMVVSMVGRGHIAQVAIDRIYKVYRRKLLVMHILQRMVRDWKEQGRHPELQVA